MQPKHQVVEKDIIVQWNDHVVFEDTADEVARLP